MVPDDCGDEGVRYVYYIVAASCLLVILTCTYCNLTNVPERIYGDAKYYRMMAMGEEGAIEPFASRALVPRIVEYLSTNVDIFSTKGENVDFWFIVITLLSLLISSLFIVALAGEMAGFLWLCTFWATGYNLAMFWLIDPFFNMLLWAVVWLGKRTHWSMYALVVVPLMLRGGTPLHSWEYIKGAIIVYSSVPELWKVFGFLWVPLVVAMVRYPKLLVFCLAFVALRLVATDIQRMAVIAFMVPLFVYGVAEIESLLSKLPEWSRVWMRVGIVITYLVIQHRVWWSP